MASRWDIAVAPLERERLDIIAPVIRLLAGCLFLAWSWVSTTFIIGAFLLPVIHGSSSGFGHSYLVGAIVSILVTIGEWVTEGEFPVVHWTLILLLDASFTTAQTHDWLNTIIVARGIELTQQSAYGLWVVSLIGGVIAAKFGEKLLLSSRRRKQPPAIGPVQPSQPPIKLH